MSSSTSPRSSNSGGGKTLDLPATKGSLPHSCLPELVDPVALIDERIKVRCLSHFRGSWGAMYLQSWAEICVAMSV